MQDGVHDAFTKCLSETAGAMKVADGFDQGAAIGLLTDMKGSRRSRRTSPTPSRRAPKLSPAGKRLALGCTFLGSTVLAGVTTDMVITEEETFGPPAPLYRFKTDDEAIKMANDTPTLPSPASGGGLGRGLAAYFYSRDIGRIRRVFR